MLSKFDVFVEKVIHKRFPPKKASLQLFFVCAFPINVWSIIGFLRELPALIIRMNISEIVGVFSYIQSLALLESILIFGILISLSVLLPPRFLKEKLMMRGAVFLFVASIYAVPVGYYYSWNINYLNYRDWLISWILVSILTLVVLFMLIRQHKRIGEIITAMAERAIILSIVYVFIDLVGIAVVIVRQLLF
jgi:hypothetical protein